MSLSIICILIHKDAMIALRSSLDTREDHLSTLVCLSIYCYNEVSVIDL